MLHKAWSSIEEVPCCFWRSSVKFQGHAALKIVEFDPNWAFPDCNSSLNSPMAMKCCTKLETAKERCPIVFQGHPWNFKVTRDKTSPILIQIWRFWTIGQSQLSNPSDLPCSNLLNKIVPYAHAVIFISGEYDRTHQWQANIGGGNVLVSKHYLSQCLPRSMLSYGVNILQLVKEVKYTLLYQELFDS